MAPVIPSSITSISLTPSVAFLTEKLNKQLSTAQNYALPLSTSVRLFPQFRIGYFFSPKLTTHIASAIGTDVVTVEEVHTTPKVDEAKRSRPARKSEMPLVKNEELLPGASFTGKVRSIQAFGAFVDFGAFTDGLVHVSQLSDSFVKDVSTVVNVGQEVTVRLVEANMETGRISLTMLNTTSDKSRPPRQKFNQKKDDNKKSSKFVKGQDLEETVKNLTRAGAFVSLPEGEEGFLPQSEEADEGFASIMGGSSLEVGQEISVRVLRITRGQVTLTMKKEEDAGKLDEKLSQGVVYTATNPFVLAFRSNKDISGFLDEQVEKTEEIVDTSVDATENMGET